MDISIIFKIAAVGIIITIICQVLKKSDRDDIATLVSLVGLILVLTVVISMVADNCSICSDVYFTPLLHCRNNCGVCFYFKTE